MSVIKTKKRSQPLQEYNFPVEGITIKAVDLKEAKSKLKNIINTTKTTKTIKKRKGVKK